MSVGGKVRELRKALNLTQPQFASRIPTRRNRPYGGSYIGKIEIGKQDPSVKYLRKIAETFGKPLTYFFSDEKPKGLEKKSLRAEKVQAVVCLAGAYDWRLGHFRKCRGCNQGSLCGTIKILINQ